MSIRMVVFDLAGTTVWDEDSAVAGRLCDALRAAGVSVDEPDVNPVMGMPKPLAIRTLMGDSFDATLADEIHEDFKRRIVDHYRTNPHVREIEGAADLFRRLRQAGARVAVDTGFDRPTLDTIVARLGWEGLLDDSVASDEVASGRPDPDMIHVLMERAGISDPAEVAKVGDSQSDLEQGARAGCGVVIAVLNERTRPVIESYPQAERIESLAEVMPILDALGLGAAPAGSAR